MQSSAATRLIADASEPRMPAHELRPASAAAERAEADIEPAAAWLWIVAVGLAIAAASLRAFA